MKKSSLIYLYVRYDGSRMICVTAMIRPIHRMYCKRKTYHTIWSFGRRIHTIKVTATAHFPLSLSDIHHTVYGTTVRTHTAPTSYFVCLCFPIAAWNDIIPVITWNATCSNFKWRLKDKKCEQLTKLTTIDVTRLIYDWHTRTRHMLWIYDHIYDRSHFWLFREQPPVSHAGHRIIVRPTTGLRPFMNRTLVRQVVIDCGSEDLCTVSQSWPTAFLVQHESFNLLTWWLGGLLVECQTSVS